MKREDNKFYIDCEAADRITVANLKDYYKYMKKSMAGEAGYLHPEDHAFYTKISGYIECIVTEYFGESLE